MKYGTRIALTLQTLEATALLLPYGGSWFVAARVIFETNASSRNSEPHLTEVFFVSEKVSQNQCQQHYSVIIIARKLGSGLIGYSQ